MNSTTGPSVDHFTLSDYDHDRDSKYYPPAAAAESSKSGALHSSLPMREVRRPDLVQQRSGGLSASDRTVRLHQHESTSFPPNRNLSTGYSAAQISPLPSFPYIFETSNTLNLDGTIPREQEEASDVGSIHKEEVEKREQGPLPTVMSREISSGSGKGRRWWDKVVPASTSCRLLLLTVILESMIDLSIESNILWRFNLEVASSDSTPLVLENKRRLPIYLIIFGLAHLWQLVLTGIAIRTRNTVQVISATLFNFAFLGYAIIEIYELRQILGENLAESLTATPNPDNTLLSLPLNVLTAVVIANVALCFLMLVIIAIFLRREFGSVLTCLIAPLLRKAKMGEVFECLCYFSAFFCAGFGIQFIWLVLHSTDVEYIITWIAFPLSVLLLVVGRFAAKYEKRTLMGGFMIGLVAGCAYFIFKLVRIWQQQYTIYAALTKSLTTFDALSLASLVVCLIFGGMVWADFGKGLKYAVLSQPSTSSFASVVGFWRTGSAGTQVAESEMSNTQRRVSID